MKTFNFVLALVCVASLSVSSYAGVMGGFTNLGVANDGQIYGFEVTSTLPILGLDFSLSSGYGFSGQFNNTGVDTDFDGVPDAPFTYNAATPQPGPLKETYFRFAAAGLLSVNVTDGVGLTSSLGAAFTRDGGAALVPANTPTVVAIFSMPLGSPAPTLFAGTIAGAAETSAGLELITTIPEPASLAMAGMCLIGLVLRRRNG